VSSDRKKDIIIAAGKCFAQFGYDKTTLDDIAEHVGINKASFYYYFKNKEAIFVELIIQEADEYIEAVNKKVNVISGCRNKILTWIKEGFKYNETNSILNKLSFETVRKMSPQLLELKNYTKQKGTEYLYSILSDCQKMGEIHVKNIRKVAQTIQNIIYALKDQAYQDSKYNKDGMMDVNKVVDTIIFTVSLILDGIVNEK
jgi:TetR/AcrR family transcriptional regulator, biofilm operon repressor